MELKKEKVTLKTVCADCGKPVGDKPRSDVTRFLSFESRCMCHTIGDKKWEQAVVPNQPSETSTSIVPTISKEEVEANLGDRFEVQELLGQGGMGVVYKARDRQLDKTFAVKVLNPKLVEDAQSVKRFEQEANAAQSLTHVNLAAVYDFGVGKQGAPYLVMDFLDGKNLAEIIRREGFLDVPRALELFIQTVQAVNSAHDKGVVHRDIKPGNIIICKRDDIELVKLVDFGIAKVLPSEARAIHMTQTGEVLGSPLYMPPEQCLGNKIDQRSDIYSLGCVMYEALTGIAPFADQNAIKTILRQVNEKPLSFEKLNHEYSIPQDLERVIFHCLEKEPDSRYQNSKELLRDLQSVKFHKSISLPAMPGEIQKSIEAKKKATMGYASVRTQLSLVIVFGITLGIHALQSATDRTPQLSTTIQAPAPEIRDNPYSEADQLSARATEFFDKGEYDKAVDLLMFNLHTYKLDGNAYHELNIAETNSLIGKCFREKGEYAKAQKYYRDALKIYNKSSMDPGEVMDEAIDGYAAVLIKLNKKQSADQITKDYAQLRDTGMYRPIKIP